MKVFVAGATGAIGRRLVPLLVARGHDVYAMTRRPDAGPWLRALGARPVVADALDEDQVLRAIGGARPDAVVHQLTALAAVRRYRNLDAELVTTNRLRTEATRFLVQAALLAGTHTFVAQSYGAWLYRPSGPALTTEEDRIDDAPPRTRRRTTAAILRLEETVVGASGLRGIALRYGTLYGPGTALAPGGGLLESIRAGRLPIIGDGSGVWSFIHVDDAARAAADAVEDGHRGPYNVADDEPVPAAAWIPELARMLGAKPPRRVPVWLGRLAAGSTAVELMTRVPGLSNEKARRELGWRPRYPSWREGFRAELADPARSGAG